MDIAARARKQMTTQSAFVGIDLAVAKRKRLPIVISRWEDGRLVPFELHRLSVTPPRGYGNAAVLSPEKLSTFAGQARTYILDACRELSVGPVRIAIDAPRAPRNPQLMRRAAESALDSAGISCFTTPSTKDFDSIRIKVRRHLAEGGEQARLPHANQLWMLYGFELFKSLSELAPCIEVYPQAIVRAIGAGGRHKSKVGAVVTQLAAASRHTGWPYNADFESSLNRIAFAPSHDSLDAYLASWVASLDEADRLALGSPPEDAIWIPRLNGGPKFERAEPEMIVATDMDLSTSRVASIRRSGPKSPDSGEFRKECPACGNHTFKRWPFGWDAHAGYRCTGMKAETYEARKIEFKARFSHMFR